MSKEPKENMNRRTKFTIFSMFNIVWYTVIVLIASFLDHTVPSELTVAWFSAWTVELALLFGIKVRSKDSITSDEEEAPKPSHTTIHNQENNFIITPQDEGDVSNYTDDLG